MMKTVLLQLALATLLLSVRSASGRQCKSCDDRHCVTEHKVWCPANSNCEVKASLSFYQGQHYMNISKGCVPAAECASGPPRVTSFDFGIKAFMKIHRCCDSDYCNEWNMTKAAALMMSGGMKGGMKGGIKGGMKGGMKEGMKGDMSWNMMGNMFWNMMEDMSWNMKEDMSGNKMGNMSGYKPGNMPGNKPGNMPGNKPGNMPWSMPGPKCHVCDPKWKCCEVMECHGGTMCATAEVPVPHGKKGDSALLYGCVSKNLCNSKWMFDEYFGKETDSLTCCHGDKCNDPEWADNMLDDGYWDMDHFWCWDWNKKDAPSVFNGVERAVPQSLVLALLGLCSLVYF